MTEFSTPTARWNALTTRNPLAANAFIYSVLTTKIYCRPTCPSRLARRANITFHNTPRDAEADGFRACMRCKPGTLSGEEGDPQRIAVQKAKDLIRQEGIEGDEKLSVKQLAKEVGLTESHFCRVFKKIEGMTVGEFRTQVKSEEGVTGSLIPVSHKTHFGFDDQLSKLSNPSVQDYGPPAIFPFVFDNTELAQDWEELSNTPIILEGFPSMDFDVLNFDFSLEGLSPELLSDPSSPSRTDDGLQFLDFNLDHALEYPV